MPHKTKKEKIIAEYRKRLRLLQSTPIKSGSNQPQEPLASTSAPVKTIPEKKQVVIETEEDSLITTYFKKDFKKSLFLIVIVITLEISLYFATINNYLRLGR